MIKNNDDSIEKLAWLLDEAFPIPGTRFRFGWDAIIGLVPGIGETVTLLAQGGVVLLAVGKYEVPLIVAARMIWNVLLDGMVGSIPIVGDIFDVFFKANTKNLKLLREVQAERVGGQVSRTRHYAYFIIIAVALFAVMASVLTTVFLVLRWLFHFIG